MRRPNVLLITLDQFRADALSCAGHPVVKTPNLDRLAADGVRLANHYAQAAPCSPGRAALYTGTYQMQNRVVANGTPLDDRFDNVARVARRAGYVPTLWGYTDQGIDPRLVHDPRDPRLSTYEGVLPGFEVAVQLPTDCPAWLEWLATEHDVHFDGGIPALQSEPDRHEDLSQTAFMTDHLLAWIERQDEPWFAHASYLRPHPPYAAAGKYSTMYDPDQCGGWIEADDLDRLTGLHRLLLQHPWVTAPTDPVELRHLRSQYFGMVTEVDHHLGRLRAALEANGSWDDTVVVVTADHGEQLGDQGLLQKCGYFDSSYHIIGIVRDPRHTGGNGTIVHRFTENVDILPTLCEAMGVDIPAQCDGYPLTPFLRGEEPPSWRDAAYYEWDWRDQLIEALGDGRPWDRRLDESHLAVRRTSGRAFVHFANDAWKCFDLEADPTWRTEITDPAVVLAEATQMLTWRGNHLDRTLTGMLLQDGGIGRVPASPFQSSDD